MILVHAAIVEAIKSSEPIKSHQISLKNQSKFQA